MQLRACRLTKQIQIPSIECCNPHVPQVESGSGALRALWRWSCLQLAERVGAGAEQAGGGLHEAAVYAALSSYLAR